jgi:hypothetical protein
VHEVREKIGFYSLQLCMKRSRLELATFQRVQSYLAGANGFIIATAALVAPLTAIIGFAPIVRKMFEGVSLSTRSVSSHREHSYEHRADRSGPPIEKFTSMLAPQRGHAGKTSRSAV